MSSELFQQRFPAKTEQLSHLREWVRTVTSDQGLPAQKVDQIVIGVNEACMNIIEHAYCDSTGDIVLKISRDDDELKIELRDFARPVDCDKIKSRDLDDIRPGGLGVHFIREVMDNVVYRPCDGTSGNSITMIVRITP